MEVEYAGVDILKALESARHYNDYLVDLVRRASDSKEVIDFGAGIGTFSKRLREAGYRVGCIEPDSSLRQKLVQEGFAAWQGIDSIPDDSAPFVFSLNVFEHIPDDAAAVRRIAEKLQPGGKLLIYVPAFKCLWSSLDDKVGHHRRYTKTTLRSLVQNAGLSVEKVRYADCLGFFAALVFRLFRSEPKAITSASIRFYDKWIFRPSRIVDHLLHHLLGKNVFVVCRKHAQGR